jgi:hypothetical protein
MGIDRQQGDHDPYTGYRGEYGKKQDAENFFI